MPPRGGPAPAPPLHPLHPHWSSNGGLRDGERALPPRHAGSVVRRSTRVRPWALDQPEASDHAHGVFNTQPHGQGGGKCVPGTEGWNTAPEANIYSRNTCHQPTAWIRLARHTADKRSHVSPAALGPGRPRPQAEPRPPPPLASQLEAPHAAINNCSISPSS